ncbi:hypothetical protein GF323_05855 [Candidatus Woesearchaeota archaeon]|nr:hypothetical protein [Candidatus Woesearchaeota archaeon]
MDGSETMEEVVGNTQAQIFPTAQQWRLHREYMQGHYRGQPDCIVPRHLQEAYYACEKFIQSYRRMNMQDF